MTPDQWQMMQTAFGPGNNGTPMYQYTPARLPAGPNVLDLYKAYRSLTPAAANAAAGAGGAAAGAGGAATAGPAATGAGASGTAAAAGAAGASSWASRLLGGL